MLSDLCSSREGVLEIASVEEELWHASNRFEALGLARASAAIQGSPWYIWAGQFVSESVGRLSQTWPLGICLSQSLGRQIFRTVGVAISGFERAGGSVEDNGSVLRRVIILHNSIGLTDLAELVGPLLDWARSSSDRAVGRMVQTCAPVEPELSTALFEEVFRAAVMIGITIEQTILASEGFQLTPDDNQFLAEWIDSNGGSARIARDERACRACAEEFFLSRGRMLSPFRISGLLTNQRKSKRLAAQNK